MTELLANISFQEIFAFVYAAKYENFTKAAEEIYVTQATISRNIDSLEKQLGTKLFFRTNKGARLTDQGKILLIDWEWALKIMEKSIEKVYRLSQGTHLELTIGDINTSNNDQYLLPFAKKFEEAYPNIELHIERADPLHIYNALYYGKFDAAFISAPYIESVQELGLNFMDIIDVPACIVISNKNSLFNKSNITISDWAEQTLIAVRNPNISRWIFDKNICIEYNIDYKNIRFVENPLTVAWELRRGDAFTIMSKLFMPIPRSELRYIGLPDCHTKSGIVFAYPMKDSNPCLKLWNNMLQNYFFSDCGAPQY